MPQPTPQPTPGCWRTLAIDAAIFVVLTLLTQVGGLVWALLVTAYRVLGVRRHGTLIAVAMLAAIFAFGTLDALGGLAAKTAGRVPLPGCEREAGARLAPAVPWLCPLQRHYAAPAMRDVLVDLARAMAARPDGTPEPRQVAVRWLDANFPAFDGFPLLPHLSHDDGRKVDLAFLYRDGPDRGGGGPVDTVRSRRFGYWAFEEPRPGDPRPCAGRDDRLTLRWDMDWLPRIGLFHDRLMLDEERTARMIRLLAADPRVTRILLEPHLAERLGVAHPKVRFQGCRAARHDDHIHVEVAGP